MSKVLLYSAGMDSVALRHIWKPDVCLYVDLKTGYSKAERERLDAGVAVVEFPGLMQFEREDKIIPFRNLVLVAIAAQYGDVVAIGATAGDRVLDKTYEFAQQATTLFSYMAQPQWWIPEGRDISVVLPVKHLTKAQIVQAYLQAGGAYVPLVDSLSCYYPAADGAPCWKCKPCLRKWVALVCNGYDPHPATAFVLKEAAETTDLFTGRSDSEVAELKHALRYAKGEHPPTLYRRNIV